jgi:isocitrate dehydrogenase
LQDPEFKALANKLKEARSQIVSEFKGCQGSPVDIGGYYKPDPVKIEAAMRPSKTFNNIIDSEV